MDATDAANHFSSEGVAVPFQLIDADVLTWLGWVGSLCHIHEGTGVEFKGNLSKTLVRDLERPCLRIRRHLAQDRPPLRVQPTESQSVSMAEAQGPLYSQSDVGKLFQQGGRPPLLLVMIEPVRQLCDGRRDPLGPSQPFALHSFADPDSTNGQHRPALS